MCGICGIAGFRDDALVRRMNQRLVHRGPDDDGYHFDDRISLAMRRLSIIDLSGGGQPIANEDQTVRVVFNGEIYNYRELREELLRKGHTFATKSDTEVIVHLYEEYGESCVDRLRGMFAFALADSRREQLLLARDRVGIKPLYYLERDGKLLFASELKALLEDDGYRREINPQALFDFLTFLYIPSPRTIFKGIHKLPAGHLLRYRQGRCTVRPYWDVPFPNEQQRQEARGKTQEEYKTEILRLLDESVRMHLVSDVPLGVFLSGGLDSGAIAALMARHSTAPIKTFSIGYGEEASSYNEVKAARIVARHIGSDHHESILTPNVMELLPRLVAHADEPFADASMIPTYLVAKAAREHVTVALTGIGGDELFGGYPRYLGAQLAVGYDYLPESFRQAAARMAGLLPESTKSQNLPGRAKRFLTGGALPSRERYLSWISFYDEPGLSRLLTPGWRAIQERGNPWERHRQWYDHPPAAGLMDKLFYVDVKGYLADDLLMMGDKMSMAASLELRVPFCDHRLLEFAAAIPAGVKFNGFRLKSLLRRSLRGLLPPEILNRKKQGFMAPIGQWLKKELKPLSRELLSDAAIQKRGYFDPRYIRWMTEQHDAGRRNFSDQLFALLTLELWHRIYLDGERW